MNYPAYNLLLKLLQYLTPPILILATISTLLQKWYNLLTNQNPYYLYSISNIGSMSALLFYPVLLEPNISVDLTVQLWKWAYLIVAVSAIIIAIITGLYVDRSLQTSQENDNLTITEKRYLLMTCFFGLLLVPVVLYYY